MRLLPDYNYRNISAITASSENVLFPASNLKELDPAVIWRASAFSSAVSITIDLGSAQSIEKIWLNNANFKSCSIQANSSDSWSSPAVSKSVTLKADDVGIFKGFFDLSSSSYRYVRVLIPTQTLIKGSVPELGNIIIGKDVDFSPITTWNPDVEHEFYTFKSDSGGYFKTPKTKPRHVFNTTIERIEKSELFSLPLNGWNTAIVFTDLNDVADSYLVYPATQRGVKVLNSADSSIDFAFEELV